MRSVQTKCDHKNFKSLGLKLVNKGLGFMSYLGNCWTHLKVWDNILDDRTSLHGGWSDKQSEKQAENQNGVHAKIWIT